MANEGLNQLFINEGGRLIDGTEGRLPVSQGESREFRAADLDGDGDQDLLLVTIQLNYEWPRDDFLFVNDGAGRFTVAEPERFPHGHRDHFTIQVADVDTDADLDVILPSSVFTGDSDDYRVLINDGAARFSRASDGSVLPKSVNGGGIGFDIQVADFNGDVREDLFLCNRARPRTTPVVGGKPSLLFKRPAE